MHLKKPKAMQIMLYDNSVFYTNDMPHNPSVTHSWVVSQLLTNCYIYHLQVYNYFLVPKWSIINNCTWKFAWSTLKSRHTAFFLQFDCSIEKHNDKSVFLKKVFNFSDQFSQTYFLFLKRSLLKIILTLAWNILKLIFKDIYKTNLNPFIFLQSDLSASLCGIIFPSKIPIFLPIYSVFIGY